MDGKPHRWDQSPDQSLGLVCMWPDGKHIGSLSSMAFRTTRHALDAKPPCICSPRRSMSRETPLHHEHPDTRCSGSCFPVPGKTCYPSKLIKNLSAHTIQRQKPALPLLIRSITCGETRASPKTCKFVALMCHGQTEAENTQTLVLLENFSAMNKTAFFWFSFSQKDGNWNNAAQAFHGDIWIIRRLPLPLPLMIETIVFQIILSFWLRACWSKMDCSSDQSSPAEDPLPHRQRIFAQVDDLQTDGGAACPCHWGGDACDEPGRILLWKIFTASRSAPAGKIFSPEKVNRYNQYHYVQIIHEKKPHGMHHLNLSTKQSGAVVWIDRFGRGCWRRGNSILPIWPPEVPEARLLHPWRGLSFFLNRKRIKRSGQTFYSSFVFHYTSLLMTVCHQFTGWDVSGFWDVHCPQELAPQTSDWLKRLRRIRLNHFIWDKQSK